MYPIVYKFKLTIDDYREMSFISTFSYRKSQRIALFLAWVAGTTALLLDITQVIKLSQTIHLCALMVAVTVPMLFVSVLASTHKFKVNADRKKIHTVLLGKDDVKYSESGNTNTGLDKWDDFAYAFETKNLFLLYRTPNNAVLLPKRQATSQQILETREALKEKLGKRFKIRIRIK